MKKFLMVTTVQNTIEAFLIPHIKMLEEKGYDVWIATNINKNIPKELINNKWVNIDFSRNPFTLNSLKAIKQVRKLLRENKFEMIHFHTPVAAFLGRYAAMKEQQKNIIYTAHGFHFYKGAPLINWLIYYPMEILAARWTDKIITINDEDYRNSLKLKLKKNGKCYKIHGIGVDKKLFKNIKITNFFKNINVKKDEFIIITLAEINKNKNQIQILKALKNIIKLKQNIKYFIAGKGPEEEKLKKYIEKNNLKNNVFFLGQVEKKYVPELLYLSNLIISTSKREGLGLNIIEALILKKEVLATRNRGHKEIILDERFLVDINSSKELENKILQIYENKIHGNHDIKKFIIDHILKEMNNIYDLDNEKE